MKIVLLLMVLLNDTNGPSTLDAEPKQPGRASGSIVAQHLARLDAANRPVPPGWVRQIDDAFAALERKCWQHRGRVDQEQSIADMVFRWVLKLRQAGKTTTHLEFLMTMTQSVPLGEEDKADCAEVAMSVAKSLRAQRR